MYRVKKLKAGTTISLDGTDWRIETECYAVIDGNGSIVKSQTGHKIYWRRARAQEAANRYNTARPKGETKKK